MGNDLYVIVRDEEDEKKTEIGKRLDEQIRQKYDDSKTLKEIVGYVAKENESWPSNMRHTASVLRGYLNQAEEQKDSILAIVLDANDKEKSNASGGFYFSLDDRIGSLMNRNVTHPDKPEPFDHLYVVLDPNPYVG